MRWSILAAMFFSVACASRAAIHVGANDPLDEGWTKYRPFSSVDTFPVTNDLGLGIAAWAIDDNAGFGSGGHDGVYGQLLSPSQIASAESVGWRYSLQLRIVDSDIGITHDSITASVIDSTHTYTMQFGRTAMGNPLVMVTTGEDSGPTFEVNDPANGYHLYELVFSPTLNSATLVVDGISQITGYTGRLGADLDLGNPLGATGNINFGTTSNNFTGQANYSFVQFTTVPEMPSSLIWMLGCAIVMSRRVKHCRTNIEAAK